MNDRSADERLAQSGGDRVARALAAHGVRQIFTLCGGHTAPVLAAAKARGMRIIDVRHEVNAVFAADACARLGGVPGVAVVTAGPGVSNAVTALKNAQLAQSPLVLIGGAAPTALQGRGALQDIDQRALIAPHVKGCKLVRSVANLDRAVTEAFALAQEGVAGPVFVECPVDLLYDEATIRGWYSDASARGNSLAAIAQRWYLRRHVERMFSGSADDSTPRVASVSPPEPGAAGIENAAAALLRAERPLLLVGSQALAVPARAQLVAAAVVASGLPVYLSGMARGLLGRNGPHQCFHQRRKALREADCVVLAGVPSDFRLDYGRHVRKDATLIAANRSRREARMNRRPDVSAIGDVGRFLELLGARLAGRVQRPAWMQNLRARDAERETEIDTAAQHRGEHVNPLALLREIDRVAAEDAVFIVDGGDFAATAAYTLHPRGPLMWLDPGVFGTLGVGAGFVLGAAAVRPDAERWLIWGDGACGFSLIEFDSFVRHGVAVIAVVGNDAGWTQIAREQVKMLGDDVGTVLARTDYDRVATGLGAEGIQVRTQAELPSALARAQSLARAGRPVLVNVWLDPSAFREGSISM
ncbi:MAG TPA: thiamine pyrophosphate-binding protein [Rhodanobacteraceae bacterium]|nr:thiamine pyrophosphate-binding protein [Rhodanobacteraceae bacterium]